MICDVVGCKRVKANSFFCVGHKIVNDLRLAAQKHEINGNVMQAIELYHRINDLEQELGG